MTTNNHNDESEQRCPFCDIASNCEHVFLIVDKTFRTAVGGILMDVFNDRWSAMFDKRDEDFDESEPFSDLLDEVDLLADAANYGNHEGGPGMSSAYVIYYVGTQNKAQEALARFTAGSD